MANPILAGSALLTAFIWYVPAFAGAEYGLDLPSPIAPMQARRNESRMKIDVKTLNSFLAFSIPITIYLVVSQVVRYAIAVGLVLWLLVYVRRFKQARGRHPLKPE